MDRTFRGLAAGLIAGAVMNIWNLTDYYFFHFTSQRLLDWVAVLVSGAKSHSVFQSITDLMVQIVWDGFLGIIFSFLLVKIGSKGVIVKSVLYGTICWFIFQVVVILFKITPLITGETFPGRFSHLFGAILWGIILGYLLKQFDMTPE